MRMRTFALPVLSARRPALVSLTRTVALPRRVWVLKRSVPIGEGFAAARLPLPGSRSTPTSPSQTSVAPGRQTTGTSADEVEPSVIDDPETAGGVGAGRGSRVLANQ